MQLLSRPRLSALLLAACLTVFTQHGLPMAQQIETISAGHSGLPVGFNEGFPDHLAEANGTRPHYATGGPGDGQMVVLLHGWPQTWYTWRRVMPALAKAGCRVVAVDYRGAGDSEKPQSG